MRCRFSEVMASRASVSLGISTKTETLATARFSVRHHVHLAHGAKLAEFSRDVLLVASKDKLADISLFMLRRYRSAGKKEGGNWRVSSKKGQTRTQVVAGDVKIRRRR